MMKKRPEWRWLAAITHDGLAVALCWWVAYWLRFNLETVPAEFVQGFRGSLPLVLVLHAVVFWFGGLYRGIWRYASLMDLRRLIGAVGLAALLVAFSVLMLALPGVPRSVLLLHPLLLIMFMGGSRFAYRAWKDRLLYGRLAFSGEPVLLIGGGDAAERLIRELNRSPDWRVVGILDDDPKKIGCDLHGIKIRGAIDSISTWSERLDVNKAIIAMPAATAAARRHAIESAVQSGLSVMTVPDTADLLAGRVSISQVRQVELEDLLGRDIVALDNDGLNTWLSGKVVLVTGAGGSIGSELCRQILHFGPSCLVLYEMSEFALYQLEQELSSKYPDLALVPMVGDVKDARRLEQVFSAFRPAVVFHAAAYKHVPLMENDNAWEAVRNNVLGSWSVASTAQRHGVGHFVLISTDKAVNPTNVMGATKRLAERVVQQLQSSGGTRFVTVRFGNVLGSSGSVIPKFREQIARGGPITVTHPDIIRYFMLIPEAAQLVLQAGLMGQGGEIFVLDMGEPVKIVDLARDMIRLSGFSEEDIRIEFTGLRPGEKLYEELLADGEQTLPTPHAKLRVAKARELHDDDWLAEVMAWLGTADVPPATVKSGLLRFVPEYRPQDQCAASQLGPTPTSTTSGTCNCAT
jgi:FlaA1/EpsC-like NDP-sugar epimerase